MFDKIIPIDITDSEKEKLLEEKLSYSNSTYDAYSASNSSTSMNSKLQNNLDAIVLEEWTFNSNLSSIINKFYPDEFATIQEDFKDINTVSHERNLARNCPEIKLYNLILEIVENETLVSRIQNVCNN